MSDAGTLELGPHVTGAQAELGPPVGQHVQRGDLAGQQGGAEDQRFS